jgi:23S rRNA pseudouridine2604 synthase
MCEHFGFEVQKLERIRIMNVKLDGIPVGTYRELTEKELKGIFEMVKNSSKTAAVPKATPKVAPKPTPTKQKTTNKKRLTQ